ncbi:MAG: oxygen-dependent coproporphyrinogen-III oxidase [Pseudomonadota bacterium]
MPSPMDLAALSGAQGVAERYQAFENAHPMRNLAEVFDHPADTTDPIFEISKPMHGQRISTRELGLLTFVRNLNRAVFLSIDPEAQVSVKSWTKSGTDGLPQGGGVMTVVRGPVLEKAAVNMSVVWGPSYPSIEKEYSGQPFFAAGVSLICHPYNPNAPIAHMNIRVLKVGAGDDYLFWMGGGGDLTPMVRFQEDTDGFHAAFRSACEAHPLGDYTKFKQWCDEYFFIPHRGETRGVGGIFFDYLKVSGETDLGLLLNTAQVFAHRYAEILQRRVPMAFSDELKEQHLYWRGRYAEFNLVHDRGTRFGLMSGGNIEAIFASLPPVVKW